MKAYVEFMLDRWADRKIEVVPAFPNWIHHSINQSINQQTHQNSQLLNKSTASLPISQSVHQRNSEETDIIQRTSFRLGLEETPESVESAVDGVANDVPVLGVVNSWSWNIDHEIEGIYHDMSSKNSLLS